MILFLLFTFLFAFKTLSLELYPLKTGIGRYIGIQKQYDSVFLAKKKIEVIESSDDRNDTIIVCDVIPILLKGDKEVDLVTSCLKTHTEVSKNDIFSIINKDFSLYDNLPYAWDKYDAKSAKKRLNFYFDSSTKMKPISKIALNPMGCFLQGVEVNLGCVVTALFLYEKDAYENNAIELGAAAMFQRQGEGVSMNDTTIVNIISTDDNVGDHDKCLVFVSLGEFFSMALTTGLPITIQKDLFLASSVDADLSNQQIIAKAIKQSIKGTDSVAAPAWDIYDCNKFISMTILEKRAGKNFDLFNFMTI